MSESWQKPKEKAYSNVRTNDRGKRRFRVNCDSQRLPIPQLQIVESFRSYIW